MSAIGCGGKHMLACTGGSVDQSVVGARAVLVNQLSGIVRVWSGGHRGLALKLDGTLFLWGRKGDGSTQRLPAPLTQSTLDARQD